MAVSTCLRCHQRSALLKKTIEKNTRQSVQHKIVTRVIFVYFCCESNRCEYAAAGHCDFAGARSQLSYPCSSPSGPRAHISRPPLPTPSTLTSGFFRAMTIRVRDAMPPSRCGWCAVAGAELYWELWVGAREAAACSDGLRRVLYINGSMSDCRKGMQTSQYEALAACGLDILTFDHRGMGRSTLDVDATHYSMHEYAKDALAVADAAWTGPDEAFACVGYSFGGMVAQEVALRYPGRISRLVIAASTAGGIEGRPWPLRLLTARDDFNFHREFAMYLDARLQSWYYWASVIAVLCSLLAVFLGRCNVHCCCWRLGGSFLGNSLLLLLRVVRLE